MQYQNNAILLSIRPEHAKRLISGEKKFEFRRFWAKRTVNTIVLYATAPAKKIVAACQIGKVHTKDVHSIWELTKGRSGVSKEDLFSYFENAKTAIAIEIEKVYPFLNGIKPQNVFGDEFRPPQSFKYISPFDIKTLYATYRRLGNSSC